MKKTIKSAELLRYNANSSGNRAPDCVKRSISYAFDVPYITVAKKLNELANNSYVPGQWNVPYIYGKLIKDYGGSDRLRIYDFDRNMSESTTVNDFADTYNTGTYLLEVGKKAEGSQSSHLVAIVDGEVIDSWDSRNWYVKRLYTTDHHHSAKSDIWSEENVKNLRALCVTSCRSNWDKLTAKYAAKNDWQFDEPEVSVSAKDYKIDVLIKSKLHSQLDDTKITNVQAKFVFVPTWTYEEAESYIIKNAYTRVYDRLYEINKTIKGMIEEQEATKQVISELGVGDQVDRALDKYWMDDREKRFFNSLPGALRARVNRVSIQQPGQYSDSYSVRVIAKPEDRPRLAEYGFRRNDMIEFEAYDATQMKDMLKRYTEKGEIPDIDYDPYEEY